jgi:hypothetical protein
MRRRNLACSCRDQGIAQWALDDHQRWYEDEQVIRRHHGEVRKADSRVYLDFAEILYLEGEMDEELERWINPMVKVDQSIYGDFAKSRADLERTSGGANRQETGQSQTEQHSKSTQISR